MKRTLIGLLAWAAVATVSEAQTVGTCAPALADAYLDTGNVRARLLNNGNLFYRGEPHVYNVPKGSNSNALFATGFWIGGMEGETLRMSASAYGPYEYWPGPLDDDGNPPADCAEYDRMYSITRSDVATYEATGVARPDLVDWPTGLGAPTLDAAGNEIDLSGLPLTARRGRRIELAAGERPAFIGDQMVWWVMNDLGNLHGASGAPPVGVEVQVTAFAFDEPGHVGNATFFRYTVIKRGSATITGARVGIYMDPDLGDPGDDWAGSDSLLGLGYVWNSDNADGGDEGYGTPPPAIGVDFFQGPVVPSPGDLARVGGREIPDLRNLPISAFHVPWDDSPSPALYMYRSMQGIWFDGKPQTYGSNGYDAPTAPAPMMYTGDAAACAFWTQCNSDGSGSRIGAHDQKFVAAAGPFNLAPGDRQEILIGIVYARGSDNFDSVRELKAADAALQRFVDTWFTEWPEVPAAPVDVPYLVSPADGADGQPPLVTLHWACSRDAIRCEMQVDDDDSFNSPVFHSDLPIVEVQLEPDRSYWWRARGVGRSEIPGPWSALHSFGTGSTVFDHPIRDFQTVANASGPLDPPECGAFSFNGSRFPLVACGSDRPSPRQQSVTGRPWGIHAGGASIPFGPESDETSYLGRSWGTREATGSFRLLLPYDYEWRFTTAGGKARRAYDGGGVMDVPFELWRTGIDTPDDPSDDVRLVPVVCEQACGAGTTSNRFDVGKDHAISGGANDPVTDWVDWLLPDDTSPGQAGYEAYFAGTGGAREIMARQVLVCFNCGTSAPYPQEYPEVGTVFRILTGMPVTPILSAPADGASLPSDAVRLFWHGSLNLDLDVQVSADPSFTTPAVRLQQVPTGTAVESLTPGTWWWRVGSDDFGWSDAWSIHVLPATGVEAPGELPTSFALDAIWPNPFNPLATIRFGLPAAAAVMVDVVDVLGRRVAVLEAGGRRAAGWHTVQFDGSRLASGVYFVRLAAGGRLDVKSVVLLK